MVFKVDAAEGEVRCVLGGPWPAVDSEGDTCYDNTHFSTRRAALEKLRAECDAWLSLNFRERGRLHGRLTALQEEDKRARAGLEHALAGLASISPCAVRDGRCQSGKECQELGQCNPNVLRA